MDRRYVCSACGFSRSETRSVVEHITQEHDDEARIMEHDASGSVSRLGALLRRWKRWLERP